MVLEEDQKAVEKLEHYLFAEISLVGSISGRSGIKIFKKKRF